MQECNEIVQEGLKEEITAMIKVILDGKYFSLEIQKHTLEYFNNTGDLPEEIQTISISTSYDMV